MRGSKGNVFFNHLSIIILQVLIVFPFSYLFFQTDVFFSIS